MWLGLLTTQKVQVKLETTLDGTLIEVLSGSGSTADGDDSDSKWLIAPDTAGITTYRFTGGTGTSGNIPTKSPSSNVAGANWSNPTRVYANDTNRATIVSDGSTFTSADQLVLGGYDFSLLPADASDVAMTVRLDAFLVSVGDPEFTGLLVEYSMDAGATWFATTKTTTNVHEATETTLTLGSSSDQWGGFVQAGFISGAFRLRVTPSAPAADGYTLSLDWVAVTLDYIYNAHVKSTIVSLVSYVTAPVPDLSVVTVDAAVAK